MLLELEGSIGVLPVDTVMRKYTWGLDLAGLNGGGGSLNGGGPASSRSLEGAGGIGGLLAMQAPGAGPGAGDLNAVYTYDASGNVGQLVAWATGFGGAQGDEWHMDRLVAHYEYDPYGGLTAQSGYYAAANPVRFSTKYWDDETGLGYWGYRYYSPSLGRWISRDPLGEHDDVGLYRYVKNSATTAVDPFGLFWAWFPRAWEGSCCPQCRLGDTKYAGTTVYSFTDPDAPAAIGTTSQMITVVDLATAAASANPVQCCCSAVGAITDPCAVAALAEIQLLEKWTPKYIWIRVYCLRCTRRPCGVLGLKYTERWENASPDGWLRCPGGLYTSEDIAAEWRCHKWAEDNYCK